MQVTIMRAGPELTPQGSLDVAGRPLLVDAGVEVLHDHGCLTLNLKAVDFMDSMGIGAIVELSRNAASIGAPFAIAEPSPAVQRVLAITGLTDAWPRAQPALKADPPIQPTTGVV